MDNTLSLQELFNDRIFRVPEYQRGYSWERQQIEEFLDDLALLDTSRQHYTGTVVLHQPANPVRRMDDEGQNFIETDVVDGQQRLTTIVLLLNELSKELGKFENGKSLAQGVRKKYVVATDEYGLSLHKLTLNDDTDDFFQSSVLPKTPGVGGPPVISAQRLLDARNLIGEYLKRAGGEGSDSEEWLRDLHRKITNQLHFNLYEVERAGDVGIIFEVMNDRGKQLTDLEKVKNYLLYCASTLGVSHQARDELADAINTVWGDVLRQLMAAGLGSAASENQLLRSDWFIRYDPRRQNWDGSKSIRRRFDLREKSRHVNLLGELHDYVRGLRDSCVTYCDALAPDRVGAFSGFTGSDETKDEVALWNRKLLRIRLTATFLPLLMAVRQRWPADLDRYLEIVRLCEVFAFRTYRIAGYYVNYRQPAMYRLANDVMKGLRFEEAVGQLIQMFSATYAQQMFDEFTNPEHLQSRYDWTGLRYFLYEYEQHLAEKLGGSPKVNWAQVSSGNTVEHILPQSIDDRPYWQERFEPAVHEKYKHDLGNLALTADNSSLGNKSFPDKKGQEDFEYPCYADSLLLEERELTKWDDWKPKSIDERRKVLLEWAEERWYFDFGGSSDDNYAGDPDDDDED